MSDIHSLQNLTVVVTGANGALGRAVVAAALARGAQVVGVDVHFEDGPTAAGEIVLVDAYVFQPAPPPVACDSGWKAERTDAAR